jgi:hypothetical protein
MGYRRHRKGAARGVSVLSKISQGAQKSWQKYCGSSKTQSLADSYAIPPYKSGALNALAATTDQ